MGFHRYKTRDRQRQTDLMGSRGTKKTRERPRSSKGRQKRVNYKDGGEAAKGKREEEEEEIGGEVVELRGVGW